MFKKVYLFNEKTGEFAGEFDAQRSPLDPEVRDDENNVISEQKYLIPTFSTEKKVPKLKVNEAAFFVREVGEWVVKADFRGKVAFDKDTGVETLITDPGDLPANTSLELPAHIAKGRDDAKAIADARADRDARMNSVLWRIDRNARERRLGLPETDDLGLLDAYVQALADVPKQKGFPLKIKWPTLGSV